MEPALRRGDLEGVGGGSRMLRLHAQLISASAAVRMNEIGIEIERCRLRRHRWRSGCGALGLVSLQAASLWNALCAKLRLLLALRDLE